MTDFIRVLRILEYTGDRALVEDIINRSIQGHRVVDGPKGTATIRAATIGTYPEILFQRVPEPKEIPPEGG
jgi:hypothetical protein